MLDTERQGWRARHRREAKAPSVRVQGRRLDAFRGENPLEGLKQGAWDYRATYVLQ